MTWSYDSIADVYATDMGQSMPFDDVDWYRSLCLREGGRALELGCGTGRILIELLRAGVDAIGADRSLPMLARLRGDAKKYTLSSNVLQMDIAEPALCAKFRVVLLPYSLITYLRDPAIAEQCVRSLAGLLEPGGCLVLDAFVPQPVASFADFRRDYRREHEGGFLERHKRITANADGTNRIERRYTVRDVDDVIVSEFFTDETIRPYRAVDLAGFGAAASLVVESFHWDYGSRGSAEGARFATVVLRRA
ncbi:MAG: class I SAM-dependent methyltransferase [Proteobacteria bacterium]|uniref:class I SAM-dependent DNA methyltransferase n=1 Tax=Rudaea sp. TaxID=2136325 RepID=UPI00321F83FE|nr:class I SAM-dependent methyltransferase [Pseudomonadota bacterium]